jgi:hypothetical protein
VQERRPQGAWRWHACFDHLNFQGLRRLADGDMVDGLQRIDHVGEVCDNCLTGKQRRLSFSSEAKYRVAHKLELVHGDLCGPMMPSTPSRNKYFILLVNDLSRYMWISLMGSKDQDLASFMAFKSRAKAKSKKKVGTLCTYHGGEFTKRTFVEHCMNEGIRGHLTAPYTP